MNPAETIAGLGRELGLCAVGLAPLGPVPEPFAAAFREFIASGRAAGMDYLSSSAPERLDPRRRWPWARTAVVAALALPRENLSPPGTLAAALSRHLLGDDYHEVMAEKLRQLEEVLRVEIPGLGRAEVAVDSAPLPERALAASAGIGQFGRNCCLYVPGAGSWVVLGEILVEAELAGGEAAPGPALLPECEGCSACIEACPTGALSETLVLDARRCLSYLTVEHRGELPKLFFSRPTGGKETLFGCDECQAACPANRGVRVECDGRLAPRERYRGVRLDELVGIGKKEFAELFAGSGLLRLGRAGLRRNARAVAARLARGVSR